MVERKWTAEQQKAITLRGNNILVAAGAGSGKTSVLIERIIQRLLDQNDPVDVDKLLVVTYTNAAAAEMKHRLAVALHNAVNEQPRNKHLARQLSLLQRAQITTLHSFCLDVVKKYAYLLDLDPESKVGNETDLYILRENVLDKLFEESYAEEDSPLRLLLRTYSRGLDDQIIKEMILNTVEAANSMPNPQEWIENLAYPYEQGELSQWMDYLLASVVLDAEHYVDDYQEMIATCSDPASGLEKYLEGFLLEQAALRKVSEFTQMGKKEPLSWARISAAVGQIQFFSLPRVKNDQCDPDLKSFVQEKRNAIKGEIKKWKQQYFWQDEEEVRTAIASLAPVARALVRLCIEYRAAWQQAKRSRGYLEFSDLEQDCLTILADSEVSSQMRREYTEVFVDEYQDINRVQEAILNIVAGQDNRFMVGDIKQSIYRFRMAEPGLFNEKYRRYEQKDGGWRIDLMDNFRSQANIIQSVNFLFRQLMSGNQMEILYDHRAELKAGNETLSAEPVEVLLLDQEAIGVVEAKETESAQEEDDPVVDMQKAEKEALVIANAIQREIAAGRSYQDCCILLRTVKNVAVVMKDVLQQAGIPCMTEGQSSFFETAEIEIAVNLLQIIDNPLQDIEMAAVLHSPIVGLTLAELAELRVLAPEESLYEAIKKSEDPRIKHFLSLLQEFRCPGNILGMKDFCKEVFIRTGLLAVMTAQTSGELRRDNLLELLNVAAEYDESAYCGLYRFISYLKWLRERGKDSRKQVHSCNAVTIMSIHRSKGLEFPVVFLAGLDKPFNKADFRKDLLLHREMGLGLRCVDLRRRIKYKTLGYDAISMKMDWELKAEELRVLYVAMTRAKEKLILVGTVKNRQSVLQKARSVYECKDWILPVGIIKKSNNLLDWIIYALARHRDAKDFLLFDEISANPKIAGDPCCWEISFIEHLPKRLLNKEEKILINGSQLVQEKLEKTALKESIRTQLDWKYRHRSMGELPIKWSATTLNARKQPLWIPVDKEEKIPENDWDDVAAEYRESSISDKNWYIDMGICVHYLLEKVDLSHAENGKQLQPRLERLLAEYPVSADWKEQIDTAEIAQFFDTDVGQQLLAARRASRPVLREADFTLVLTMEELARVFTGKNALDEEDIRYFARCFQLDYQQNRQEKVFFQGVIDLCFQTPSGWILVDYKSGKSHGLTDAAVRQKYGSQLELYQLALKKITAEKVRAKYIYYTMDKRLVAL